MEKKAIALPSGRLASVLVAYTALDPELDKEMIRDLGLIAALA